MSHYPHGGPSPLGLGENSRATCICRFAHQYARTPTLHATSPSNLYFHHHSTRTVWDNIIVDHARPLWSPCLVKTSNRQGRERDICSGTACTSGVYPARPQPLDHLHHPLSTSLDASLDAVAEGQYEGDDGGPKVHFLLPSCFFLASYHLTLSQPSCSSPRSR